MKWILKAVTAQHKGLSFEVPPGSWLLGRDQCCKFVVLDNTLSTRHCYLVNDNDRLTVQDNGSTNGIQINGISMQSGLLYRGDILALGGVEFLVDGHSIATESKPVIEDITRTIIFEKDKFVNFSPFQTDKNSKKTDNKYDILMKLFIGVGIVAVIALTGFLIHIVKNMS